MSFRKCILGAVLFACCLSVGVWHSADPILVDSTEYIFGAKSLFAGDGFTSIQGTVQTHYTPGYPITIGLLSLITRDPVTAGRLIALVASIASVVPLMLISERLFDTRSAIAVGFIYSALPARLLWSSVVLSESLYVFLVLTVVWLWVKQGRERRCTKAIAVGALLGYAYLVRPEGCLVALVLFSASAICPRSRNLSSNRYVVLSAVVFLMFSIPYVLFLHVHTGRWTLSAKGQASLGWMIAASNNAPGKEAWRLNPECTGIDFGRLARESRSELLSRVLRNARREAHEIAVQLGKILKILIVIGIPLEFYRRNAVIRRALPVLVLLGLPLAYLPLLYPESRLVFTGITPMVMLAGWQLVTRFKPPWVEDARSLLARATVWLPLTIVVLNLLYSSRWLLNAPPSTNYIALARWMRQVVPAGCGVISNEPRANFYSGHRYKCLPYDSLDRIVRYANNHGIRYVMFLKKDFEAYDFARELHTSTHRNLMEPIARWKGFRGDWGVMYKIEEPGS